MNRITKLFFRMLTAVFVTGMLFVFSQSSVFAISDGCQEFPDDTAVVGTCNPEVYDCAAVREVPSVNACAAIEGCVTRVNLNDFVAEGTMYCYPRIVGNPGELWGPCLSDNTCYGDNVCRLVGTNEWGCREPSDKKEEIKPIPFNICAQIPEADIQGRADCCSCITGGNSSCVGEMYDTPPEVKYVWTAIGCISTDPANIVVAVIRIALSVAGAVVLLTILASAFMLSVSQGDAKKVEDAKNNITAAVSGLLFIIFSMVILRFVGVDVLQIPGF